MPGREDIHKTGVRFSSTNQPKNRGRKKKIYTILKRKGYSGEDIKTAFGEMAWYTLDELKKVHKDPKKPIITRIVANQFYLALTGGNWTKIKEILEHTIGKPPQTIDQNTEITVSTDEARNQLAEALGKLGASGTNSGN